MKVQDQHQIKSETQSCQTSVMVSADFKTKVKKLHPKAKAYLQKGTSFNFYEILEKCEKGYAYFGSGLTKETAWIAACKKLKI